MRNKAFLLILCHLQIGSILCDHYQSQINDNLPASVAEDHDNDAAASIGAVSPVVTVPPKKDRPMCPGGFVENRPDGWYCCHSAVHKYCTKLSGRPRNDEWPRPTWPRPTRPRFWCCRRNHRGRCIRWCLFDEDEAGQPTAAGDEVDDADEAHRPSTRYCCEYKGKRCIKWCNKDEIDADEWDRPSRFWCCRRDHHGRCLTWCRFDEDEAEAPAADHGCNGGGSGCGRRRGWYCCKWRHGRCVRWCRHPHGKGDEEGDDGNDFIDEEIL